MKQIYRQAIEPAQDGNGEAWWQEVSIEVHAVVSAATLDAAAKVIEWWHSEERWREICDSPRKAARRIQRAAAKLPPSVGGQSAE
ncbi:hypothetical protein [Chitinimonas koreensis]|uniref:hypothetical protein n=1 Tax=Chitinimonas koreensis TaxID=356302 RepID=UPI00223E955D|nr:hypothetical protein [Chitinimonas koreensis]